MQFFLNKTIPENQLLSFLENLLKMKISRLDEDIDAKLFITFESYAGEFTLYFSLNWPHDIDYNFNSIKIAQELVKKFNCSVVTDVPDSLDPFMWLIVEQNGNVFEISEDMHGGEKRDYLKLDYSSKKLYEKFN
jgi:hypothetical protein